MKQKKTKGCTVQVNLTFPRQFAANLVLPANIEVAEFGMYVVVRGTCTHRSKADAKGFWENFKSERSASGTIEYS